MNLVRFRYGENNINTGPLKEIPEICVDHFLLNDLNSFAFFLSHAHTDHLVGLETEEFLRRLRQPGVRLYCHPLTPILLGAFERYLQGPDGISKLIADRKLVPLDVEKPHTIRIPRASGYLDVTVTLLPAGHCPGSVMFLFETPSFRVLHTGDFRLLVDDLKRMSLLHKNGVPKQIDHLYVDTTFCCASANIFPCRKEVLNEAFDHIDKWLALSDKHIINISFSAKFAHEYVLLEINRKFGQKIHVTPERLKIYQYIPEIHKIVTLNNQTRFHLCGSRNCLEDSEIMTMRLASMWYTKTCLNESKQDAYISWRGSKYMMLCYSMHASLEEIGKTIDYLKPRIVTPLVLPQKTELEEVYSAIRSVTKASFEFEDYRSSRNDFEGIDVPVTVTLCIEERDETHDVNIEEEIIPDDADNNQHICSSEYEGSPAKRLKANEEGNSYWKFTLTPSPKSKSSQSSTSDGSQSTTDGSQDANSQNSTNEFIIPNNVIVKKSITRRNLLETYLNDRKESLETRSDEYVLRNEDGDNEDDPSVNSQRL